MSKTITNLEKYETKFDKYLKTKTDANNYKEYLLIDSFEGSEIWASLLEIDEFLKKYFIQECSKKYKEVFEEVKTKLPFFDELKSIYC